MSGSFVYRRKKEKSLKNLQKLKEQSHVDSVLKSLFDLSELSICVKYQIFYFLREEEGTLGMVTGEVVCTEQTK
jgi:hypothetical protein